MKTISEREQAIKDVKKFIKPNTTIYCLLRHVSSSGMMRRISFFVIHQKKPRIIDWYIEKILDYKRDRQHEGLKVGGCGMDMGFSVVYNLGSALWPNGTEKPHGTRNGEPDSAGGYALEREWV